MPFGLIRDLVLDPALDPVLVLDFVFALNVTIALHLVVVAAAVATYAIVLVLVYLATVEPWASPT